MDVPDGVEEALESETALLEKDLACAEASIVIHGMSTSPRVGSAGEMAVVQVAVGGLRY